MISFNKFTPIIILIPHVHIESTPVEEEDKKAHSHYLLPTGGGVQIIDEVKESTTLLHQYGHCQYMQCGNVHTSVKHCTLWLN